MGRQYTIEHYPERLTRIREAVPGIAVSTDIIVGFCGETEAQFEETLALLETVRYDQVFAAAYSPRPGTPATHLEDDVPAADKRRRLNTLLAVQEAIGLERNEAWLGREVEVLVDAVHAPREHEHEAPEPAGRAAASPAGRVATSWSTWRATRRSSGARSSSGSSTPARTRCEGPWFERGSCGALRHDRQAADPPGDATDEVVIRVGLASMALGFILVLVANATRPGLGALDVVPEAFTGLQPPASAGSPSHWRIRRGVAHDPVVRDGCSWSRGSSSRSRS